jgi:hypothetical protein
MKLLAIALAILVICAAVVPAAGDVCVKQKRHMDEYYYGGLVTPEENTEYEMWIGGKRMAYVTDTQIVIVDVGKGVLKFANKRDSTYVETALPFEWTNVLDEEAAGYLAQYRTEGVIKETDKTKKILGRDCKCYFVQTWVENGGQRYNEREETIWLTTDLAIDWEAYSKISAVGMQFQNYDVPLVEAFTRVPGLPLLMEADVYQQGFSVKQTDSAFDIIEAQPKTDVYSVPDYFTRKDKLTMADLRD